ncbi:MAG: RNA-splicing ligase RtcB [Candidatus Eisenbacteria bacterium RBG_16_71_46]|nr:MAG: RNA-splicing ligase RtcB [Candidatus Eisenbacteria bacterium RBG_16_71_46]
MCPITYAGAVQLDEFRWMLPKEGGMRVPGVLFADRPLLEKMLSDRTPQQVRNAAHLPGILEASIAMPDAHWGYGLPVGGVVATDPEEGVISPGAVGYDIGCGVRLLRSRLTRAELAPLVERLADALFRNVPCGVGSSGAVRVAPRELERVLRDGAGWAVQRGFGTAGDLEHCEEGGVLEGADPDAVSQAAHQRGRGQLGTLGSGNHFLEVQEVEQVYDERAAAALGIARGEVTVMIHCGSRGLGHQVCTDHVRDVSRKLAGWGIVLPDRQLACAPLASPEAQAYVGAMRAAANFAWANRQCIADGVRRAFSETLGRGPADLGLSLVYDVAHNIAKFEHHETSAGRVRCLVHRKGATRAFPAGHPDVPAAYRAVGQPVLVPGDMGRYSYVLIGSQGAMRYAFGSTCHGAGRQMSRTQAVRDTRGRDLVQELRELGVVVRYEGRDTLREETSEAYKDVADVVRVVQGADLARPVARLKPFLVVKG